jgi:type I restriction enzyme M protein
LFFTKGEPTKEIWYFEHPYPEGQKSYSKTKPIRIEEFDLEKQWWNNRVENEFAWRVPIDDIKKNNYNLDIKNPNNQDDKGLPTVDELLERIKSDLKRSEMILKEIQEVLEYEDR